MKGKAHVSAAVIERAREARERQARGTGAAEASQHIEALAYELFVVRGRDAAGLADAWLIAERALTLGHEPVSID